MKVTSGTIRAKAVKCEVYSRVVGYYRPVQDWNRGKTEEYHDRHQMSELDLASPITAEGR